MQKKIIAIAVAGLVSGAAFAQSNVTLYGRADLGYTYSKSDFRKFQGVDNGMGIGGGSSRIGLMGEEALGGGLKAVFRFEWGLNADIGEGPVGARFTYVGLAGSFGTVTLGRIGAPSDTYFPPTSPWGIGAPIEPIGLFRDNRANMQDRIIGTARWDNSIAYASPKFSGLDFMAIYSFGEKVNGSKNTTGSETGSYVCADSTATAPRNCVSADTTDASALGLGVRYANGPLYLTAAYQAKADDDSVKSWTNPGNRGYGAKGLGVGGAYDFKLVKVYANYFRAKANHDGRAIAPGSGSDKQTAWSLSVGVPVGSAGTVVAEYAAYKDYLNRTVNGRAAGHKAKGYALGYRHNLSRRTSLYAYVTRIDNDRGINMGLAKTGVAGEKQTNVSLGIVHVF